MSGQLDGPFAGIPVVRSDLLPPGTVIVGHFPAGFLDPGPLELRPKLGWRAEIRQIVRDGLAARFPWLQLPPPLPDEDELLRWQVLASERIAMSVQRPDAFVKGVVL